MSTIAVLRKARELYAANPSHAPLGDYVQDGCVCLFTATSHAAVALCFSVDADLLADDAIQRAIGVTVAWESANAVIAWNAEHTTEQVLAAFDRAIQAEEANQ